jgi:hypothetical protein
VAEVLPPWLAARDGVGGKRRGDGPARAGPY